MNQKNEELGYKKVGSKFSCKALEMDSPRIFCELLEQNMLWKRVWVRVEFVLAG